MQAVIEQVAQFLADRAPTMLVALGILVGGWIVALMAAAATRGLLNRTTIDNQLAKWLFGPEKAGKIEVERVAGQIVFYVGMLFVFVGFFQKLGLTLITEPLRLLLNEVFGFAPQLAGAILLLGLAWAGATTLRLLLTGILDKTQLDEKFAAEAGMEGDKPVPLAKTLGDAVYWMVFLLFLPAILGTLGLQGILEPVQGMLNKALGFLPNLLTAALTLAVGWFLARVVQRIVTNVLAALGADRLSETLGLNTALGSNKLSGLVGILAYVLILIPVLISALNALALEAITRPASNMLGIILAAVPSIFAAALLLALAYLAGKIVAGLITNVLSHTGFDGVFGRLGLKIETKEGRGPSAMAGMLVNIAILFFAGIEAFRLLGFATAADLVANFMVIAGHILMGLVVFAVGLYLANLAAGTIRSSQAAQANLLATASRVSIVVLASAMALRQMGLANEIINLAFGILLGSVAVAIAIAFGLGGRDAAARFLDDWAKSVRSERT